MTDRWIGVIGLLMALTLVLPGLRVGRRPWRRILALAAVWAVIITLISLAATRWTGPRFP